MSFTLANKRKLSFSRYGKQGGIPIIILHGSPGSRIAQEEAFFHEAGLEIIYPERPGYGNSSPNPLASFKSWAVDVVALLDHLEIEEVHIGGESAGGAYTLACVAYYPERFHSATLIASAAPPQIQNYSQGMAFANKLGFWLNRYAPYLARSLSRRFARGARRNPNQLWQQIEKQLCPWDQALIRKARESGQFQVYIDHLQEAFKNGAEGHIADMRILAGTWDIPFENIQCPIYIWHGEEDTLSPIAGAKAFAKWLPNTKPHFIPEAGHLLADDSVLFKKILTQIIS